MGVSPMLDALVHLWRPIFDSREGDNYRRNTALPTELRPRRMEPAGLEPATCSSACIRNAEIQDRRRGLRNALAGALSLELHPLSRVAGAKPASSGSL